MKEFWIYTGMRLLMFVASFALIFGIWSLIADVVPMLPVLLLALLVSGVASYFLLGGQRARLAARVEQRATAATRKVQEMRAKEDGSG